MQRAEEDAAKLEASLASAFGGGGASGVEGEADGGGSAGVFDSLFEGGDGQGEGEGSAAAGGDQAGPSADGVWGDGAGGWEDAGTVQAQPGAGAGAGAGAAAGSGQEQTDSECK